MHDSIRHVEEKMVELISRYLVDHIKMQLSDSQSEQMSVSAQTSKALDASFWFNIDSGIIKKLM